MFDVNDLLFQVEHPEEAERRKMEEDRLREAWETQFILDHEAEIRARFATARIATEDLPKNFIVSEGEDDYPFVNRDPSWHPYDMEIIDGKYVILTYGIPGAYPDIPF